MDNPLAVSQLCANGFEVNAKDKTGKSAVRLALEAGLDDVLRELQACGADIASRPHVSADGMAVDTDSVAVCDCKLWYTYAWMCRPVSAAARGAVEA